jgi:hypothetical protein
MLIDDVSLDRHIFNGAEPSFSNAILALSPNDAGHGPVSLQHKQFWNRSSTKEGSFDRAAVVVQRFATLVSHIERRIRLGMQEKQSLSKLPIEVQKSKFKVCSCINVPAMLSFWI